MGMPLQQAKERFSLGIIGIIMTGWLVLSLAYGNNRRPMLFSDAVHYWSYLPAAIVHHDLTLSYLSDNPEDYQYKYFPEKAPNGKKVIKVTMGVSLLLCPFFMVAHFIAKFTGVPADGFSQIYQSVTALLGTGFYLLLGLWCLRLVLKRFYTDRIAGITMLILFASTNLGYYAFAEPLLAHTLLFSVMSVFVFAVVKWHDAPVIKWAVLLGVSLGFITLIRPTMGIFTLLPIFYGIWSKASFMDKWQLIRKNYVGVMVAVLCCVVVGLPQMIYWKYITGQWLFFSYTGERFFWNQPHLLDMWFSYRKGWFLYTPVMVFSILGFLWLYRYAREWMLPALVSLALTFYVLSCWWVWWYGGSISQRAYIDFYPLLAFPLAAAFTRISNIKGRVAAWSLVVVLALFSSFKVWQYTFRYIHHDGMNKKLYWETLFATDVVDSYWSKLHFPNYSRAQRGLPQYLEYDGRNLLIRDDLDLSKGAFCENDSMAITPELSIAFPDLRIPHGNRLYGLVDFTSHQALSDSCRLVIKILNEKGTWTEANTPLNKFERNNKGKASAYILFTYTQSQNDVMKVYVQNPLKEKFCITNLMMCEEVY